VSAFLADEHVKMVVETGVNDERRKTYKQFVVRALRLSPHGYWEYQLSSAEGGEIYEQGKWVQERELRYA
jgi:hypothetical protein